MRALVAQGLRPTFLGMAIGLAGALVLGRAVSSLLYGVTPTDPVTMTAVAALLGAVATGACLLPALRATRVDPMRVLRDE